MCFDNLSRYAFVTKQETKILYDIPDLKFDCKGKWKYIVGEYNRGPCLKHAIVKHAIAIMFCLQCKREYFIR